MLKLPGNVYVRKGSGLFRKYFLITISIIFASFIITGSAMILLVADIWKDEKLHALVENAESMSENAYTTMTLFSHNWKGAGSAVYALCSNLTQVSDAVDADFFVINTVGETIFCQHTIEGNMSSDGSCIIHREYIIPEDIIKTINKGDTYRSSGDLGGMLLQESFIVATPIMSGDEIKGAIVAVQSIESGLFPYIYTIFRMFLFASLFSLLLAFILVYYFSYRLVRPLRQMSRAAAQYANGDFSTRITVKTHKKPQFRTEIDDLSESFNSMAQALSGLEMSRRSFVSNVSHELKTPMTTISGFIDGILDGTITGEERDKYLKIVSDEVKRLSRLVTGMLNMSKLEAGKMDLKIKEFDISEMIFTTLLSFEQIIEGKNVEVRGLDSFKVNNVNADKDMINQVVYNLIDNAVKFTPDNGYIEVVSKNDNEKAIIRIKNSGKGVSPEETEKIFERFYKIDKSRSYDVKGAGLGLYLCRTIVEMHGGHIECRSTEGEYTEFIFTLPNR